MVGNDPAPMVDFHHRVIRNARRAGKSPDTYRVRRPIFKGFYSIFICSAVVELRMQLQNNSIVAYGSLAAANKQSTATPIAIQNFPGRCLTMTLYP